jgi:hypothetical protein
MGRDHDTIADLGPAHQVSQCLDHADAFMADDRADPNPRKLPM